MKSKRGLFIVFLIIFSLFGSIIYYVIKSNNTITINSNIKKMANNSNNLYLSEITPFDWDKAFIIEDPYIGGDALDKIVGVKCGLERLNSDWHRRIIFIKNDKFVYGYIYSWHDIQFKPLGAVITKEQSKFDIAKDHTGRIFLQSSLQ